MCAEADALETPRDTAVEVDDSCKDFPERRDSTKLRKELHSRVVHPSRFRHSSFGQTQGCPAGGADRFCVA
jgi:hypothetical protein